MRRLLKLLFAKEKTAVEVKPEPAPPLFVDIYETYLKDEHKVTIKAYLKSPAFEVQTKHLTCQLLQMMLKYEVKEEFKSGWLSCLRAMENLPVDDDALPEEDGDVYLDDPEDL